MAVQWHLVATICQQGIYSDVLAHVMCRGCRQAFPTLNQSKEIRTPALALTLSALLCPQQPQPWSLALERDAATSSFRVLVCLEFLERGAPMIVQFRQCLPLGFISYVFICTVALWSQK